MRTIITSHARDFMVYGTGFHNNHDDFDRGIDAIRAALDAMPAAEVATIHRLGLDWVRSDCDGDRPSQFDTLEVVGERAATEGWHRPEAVQMSVSASA